ncbi:MAG: Mut7-C RNAse domain-containing protein [Desulfurococcales archaeon]|nr:Mut7-C RNAse domain-containing protein [Desulfurococcales archaeon]
MPERGPGAPRGGHPGEPRFIVDTMLGDLARWLRLLGYDTYYSSRLDDWEILRRAEREGRIIVTMDRGLASRARRRGLRVVRIASFGAAERLAELALHVPVRLEADPSRSRCPECGGPLRPVRDKEKLRGRVPPAALEAYSVFYVCERCGRVYWEGSHWANIRRVLREAREMLARAQRGG